ncbi:hypothetical protein TI39_contig298g00056 [Zymoseptoria brevis]|uniref:Uncharacterized protein n=1 Tax=Zymoseptoria brevis TaxID=1047168 RepID=A0A0F4GW33_9PEZI|nr:hypothetical protein TI39_contig298g00056 [Zymoseptoria brevis]
MDSALRDVLLRGQHVLQLGLSVYGGLVSLIAITRLQKYESTSQKLAEWSNEAAKQLHKTRTTQTSGAIAILASLIASGILAFIPKVVPSWIRIALSPLLLLIVLFARGHIKNYWAPSDGKTVGVRLPVPNMGDYNEAQKRTEDLLKILEYLEYSWVVTSFINGMLGY